ncbi:hypothetical protein D920_00220 [Enterococcus faecalis 13-SD-W-01]|nr:hypothetical protein D920_00220 [Enterococcus faecalis 13-SD-W-01]
MLFADFLVMARISGSDILKALENASGYLGILLVEEIEKR